MTKSSFCNVRIRGIAASVPEAKRTIEDDFMLFDRNEVEKVSASTGVVGRHVSFTLTTADLCEAAANRLLQETGCARQEIDVLIFVSQTPDYPLPASSCCLQARLGLSTQCAAFDVSLGCSGYVYGLWLASSLIAAGSARRVLLLAGDTSYRTCSTEDRSTALLFGDAGSATLLERCDSAFSSCFVLGTDGSGESHLRVPSGGFRQRYSPEALLRREYENGNRRADVELFMNGPEIFAFTLREVPRLIAEVLAETSSSVDDIDYFVFHQANQFMLQHLFRRLKLPSEKAILGLRNYGNTSSASVPLALVTELRQCLRDKPSRLLVAGFGVGFSWAAASLQCAPLVVPELVLVPDCPR
jgi:3-oxoacyl-[acyl-carrier-protein] synthase-3